MNGSGRRVLWGLRPGPCLSQAVLAAGHAGGGSSRTAIFRFTQVRAPRGMLMSSYDGGVQADFLEIRILGQLAEDAVPAPPTAPASKSLVHAVPGSEFQR